MAVPITSCMSEPMMAISIMSQSSTRGTWGGQGTMWCLSPQWHVALGKLAQHPVCKSLPRGCSSHPEQHEDPERPLSASFTTQSQDERWMLSLSLPSPSLPQSELSIGPICLDMGGLREVGQRDAPNPPFGDPSFSQHLLVCSPHQDLDT